MVSFVAQCQTWLAEDQSVMSYLMDNRHMNKASIASSGIGFFPYKAQFTPTSNDQKELHKMRGRIIIPIRSEFGQLVGIAGRVPDPKEKGWLNTSFTKSAHLYGFDAARKHIFEKNKVYLFEGYFDRIIMAQHGLDNSSAVMGTNLGLRRIGMIARYCTRVCVCFDTDSNKAGFLGCLKTLADMYSVGIGRQPSPWEVTMIRLPVGEDPDDFVFKNGIDAFFALEEEIPQVKLETAEKAHEALKWQLKELRQQKETN